MLEPSLAEPVDVAVLGDEIESILTAVSAARQGARVVVVRRSEGWLGGLSTRGGLCYMDITPEHKPPLFAEFLEKAGVRRVALEPRRGNDVLGDLLWGAGIPVLSGAFPKSAERVDGFWRLHFAPEVSLVCKVLIDATPDADMARMLGVPYTQGLGGVFGEAHNILGVTPVFRTRGVDRFHLMAFEERLRRRSDLPYLLERALPYHPESYRDALIDRAIESPDGMDYIDILNPVIGIVFHFWRFGRPEAYPDAPIAIDGFNIARLPNNILGFNGMVMRGSTFEELLAYSHGTAEWPAELRRTLHAFRDFLVEEGDLTDVEMIYPDELYVRQTLNILGRDMMTAEQAIRGGVAPEDAIGTFSYWLDLRGILFSRHFPGEQLPKPVFNVGLGSAFPASPVLENFAVVSRSGGYSPIGQGACRIIQHNAMLGEALGIAAHLAVQQGKPLDTIPAGDIRPVLDTRYREILGHGLNIEGRATWTETEIRQSKALEADNAAVERLRSRAVG